ncbi:MAG: TRAP transporter large permease [Alphaproteobacteria bacterium]|nr:TRAP transporter large permease [Alphaproteobacteria bacterium]
MTTVLFFAFVTLMLVRVPVAMAVGGSVVVALIYAGYADGLYIVPQQVLEGVDNASLLAVPFFILAGNLMNVLGMTDRIFNFANALVGHFRAGLAQVNVLGSMIFAGVNGTAVADIAGLGQIEVKAMRDRGYPADFAAAMTVASSMVGPLIPPSVGLVVYAYLSNTSVARLFMAGFLPGVLVGLSLMIYNRIVATRRDFPHQPRATLAEVIASARHGITALVAPAIILGAILTGFTTATEAGVLACVYVAAVGAWYRQLSWDHIWQALTNTVLTTTVVMVIIGFSTVMGWLLAIEQAPQKLADVMLFVTDDKPVFLALLLVFLLIIGCFVEGVPAKLILVPILLPVIDAYGIDRVHFGIIIQMALLIGIATPPMGIGLYVVSEVTRVPFEKVTIAILPMLIPLIIVLLIVTYVPGFSLWLPELVLGPA